MSHQVYVDIEKVGEDIMGADMAGDERLFGKIIDLYNNDVPSGEHEFTLIDRVMTCLVS
jgi:hypothetical protein